MPRTSFRRASVVALLTLALATPAIAGPLGGERERAPHHRPAPSAPVASLWSTFLHLIGASGGTFDPNGWR